MNREDKKDGMVRYDLPLANLLTRWRPMTNIAMPGSEMVDDEEYVGIVIGILSHFRQAKEHRDHRGKIWRLRPRAKLSSELFAAVCVCLDARLQGMRGKSGEAFDFSATEAARTPEPCDKPYKLSAELRSRMRAARAKLVKLHPELAGMGKVGEEAFVRTMLTQLEQDGHVESSNDDGIPFWRLTDE